MEFLSPSKTERRKQLERAERLWDLLPEKPDGGDRPSLSDSPEKLSDKYEGLIVEAIAQSDTRADSAAVTVQSIADLRALDVTLIPSGALILVSGYYAAGDGGGGLFRLDKSDTATADDGGITIALAAGPRAKRVVDVEVNPLMWGAKGDGTGDDSTPWRKAIQWAKGAGDRLTVTGLGRKYRLTSAITGISTNGSGLGVAVHDARFLQASANTPVFLFDVSTTSLLQSGDGGWSFRRITFEWVTQPSSGHSNSAAFLFKAPAFVDPARDYSLAYNSVFTDLRFLNAHTGFRTSGKAVVWGSEFSNLRWYGGCVGPLFDWSESATYQASSPGNQFRLLYARVDGYTAASSGGTFIHLNTQRDCVLEGLEFNLAKTGISTYVRIDGGQNLDLRNIRLEGNSASSGGGPQTTTDSSVFREH